MLVEQKTEKEPKTQETLKEQLIDEIEKKYYLCQPLTKKEWEILAVYWGRQLKSLNSKVEGLVAQIQDLGTERAIDDYSFLHYREVQPQKKAFETGYQFLLKMVLGLLVQPSKEEAKE